MSRKPEGYDLAKILLEPCPEAMEVPGYKFMFLSSLVLLVGLIVLVCLKQYAWAVPVAFVFSEASGELRHIRMKYAIALIIEQKRKGN